MTVFLTLTVALSAAFVVLALYFLLTREPAPRDGARLIDPATGDDRGPTKEPPWIRSGPR